MRGDIRCNSHEQIRSIRVCSFVAVLYIPSSDLRARMLLTNAHMLIDRIYLTRVLIVWVIYFNIYFEISIFV